MPIYEYQCEKCRKVFNFLVRSVSTHKPPKCPKCGHPKMSRVISRFAAVGKRGTAGAEAGDDLPPGLDGLDENDPKSLGRMMRQMAAETGEEMPAEMDEMCRRLESGEDPEKIEAEMGDLLGDEGAGGVGGPGGAPDNTLYEA